MSNQEQIKERIDSLERERSSEPFSLKGWWEKHLESMELEDRAREKGEVHLQALQLRESLRKEMANQVDPSHRKELSQLLGERKGEIEKILENPSENFQERLSGMYRLQDEIFFLLRLLGKVENKLPDPPTRQLEMEIDEMENLMEELQRKNGHTLRDVFREKAEARESLFLREVDRYLQDIETFEEMEKIPSALLWKLFEEAHKLQREGEWLCFSKYLEEARVKIIQERLDQLLQGKEKLFQKIAGCPEAIREEFWEVFFDHCSSLMAKIEELPLPKAIHLLGNGRLQISEMERFLQKDPPREIQKKHKRFKKYFRNEEMEKKLQHRLEGIFGYKFVSFFENLILFLIFAVLGLLFVEWIWADVMTPFQKDLLTWADIAICFVFLLEFFTKMFLSVNKILYFRNHFWFDFVPSIPFGLLHLGETADMARAGRIARLGRLARILRYIRVARPIIRLFRVFLLMLRVLDRLVKKYAFLLNRNIILFSQDQPLNPTLNTTLEEDLYSLTNQMGRRIKTILQSLPLKETAQILQWRLHRIDVLLEKTDLARARSLLEIEGPRERISSIREISLDLVIAQFLHMDEARIQQHFGTDGAESFVRYLRYFNLPLLRRLPIFREVIPYANRETALALSARAGRAVGRFIERVLGAFYYFADFYGIVTPSQLLDRLGKAMVNATQRPTKRLLMFGGIFFIIQILVYVMGVETLEPATKWLSKNLGLPIILLGALCALPLAIGSWLTRIAGQASAFYERVAEAQYINLLKEVKYKNCARDVQFLFSRALAQEHPEGKEGHSLEEFQGGLDGTCNLHFQDGTGEISPWLEGHLVSLLYRDYLDGAVLHSSDIKTSEQLSGNLTIDAIKRQKLKYTAQELKHLEKLDLTEGKGFLGPYIWFNFITRSLAQRTARLVVDYNKNCIPLEDLSHVTEEERTSMKLWVQVKQKGQEGLEDSEKGQEKIPEGRYRTTEFTALHFLTTDLFRDHYIEQRFGREVLVILQRDRKAMVRDVFGTYPLHTLPKTERTFNPYEFYQNYCAGGKIFLMPLFIGHLVFKGVMRIVRFLIKCVRDILQPDLAPQHYEEGHTGFGVALRNINRMRKPIFLEILRMRSRYDHEFLGLATPGYSANFSSNVMEDLDFIGTSADDYRYYQSLIDGKRARLIRFQQFLTRENLEGEGLDKKLLALGQGEDLLANRYRILRALTIGYTIDYKSMASVYEADADLEEYLDRILAQPERLKAFKKSPPLCRKKNRDLLDRYWSLSKFKDLPEEKKNQCFRSLLADQEYLKKVRRVVKGGGREEGLETLQEVLQHWHLWNQELLSLRTVQTLAVMDVINYRHVVYETGDYSVDSPPLAEFDHPQRKAFDHNPKVLKNSLEESLTQKKSES